MTILDLDPQKLAQAQRDRDAARMKDSPELYAHKRDRMRPSPFAFLRGTAPLFYEVLAARPELAKGPAGRSWLVGDSHIENFGAYRPDPITTDDHGKHGHTAKAAFHVNDYDEAVLGPPHLDVLRLVTSVILALRDRGEDAPTILSTCEALVGGYRTSAFSSVLPATPVPVEQLLEQVAKRSRKDLLDGRTEMKNGRRRFARGPRYHELSGAIVDEARVAFAGYVKSLREEDRPDSETTDIVDLAFRVAGTGSLGCLRIGVLVRGKGDPDSNWVFDMKEEWPASAEPLLGAWTRPPAERVSTALAACLRQPPRLIGTTHLGGRSMLVRRLVPQEDKLATATLKKEDLAPVATYLGALLAETHRLSAQPEVPAVPWTAAEAEALIDKAISLAALHESTWLWYFRS